MAKKRMPKLARRHFPKPDRLAAMRSELKRWGWTLTQGGDGYWYASDPFYMMKLCDRNADRAYHLAMANITRLNAAYDEAAAHESEAAALADDQEEI